MDWRTVAAAHGADLRLSPKAVGICRVPGPNWSGQLTSKKPGFNASGHIHAAVSFTCSNSVIRVIRQRLTLIWNYNFYFRKLSSYLLLTLNIFVFGLVKQLFAVVEGEVLHFLTLLN